MVKLVDPLLVGGEPLDPRAAARRALKEDRKAAKAPSSADVVTHLPVPLPEPDTQPIKQVALSSTAHTPAVSLEARIKADFRVFLTLIWRHLLGNDPNPIQLDMAYWLQHGPSRAIIMAFRGFSKSWITGAYALWRLYCDPDEKVMVVSGSLKRAVATSNWCLGLVMTMPLLAHMRPKTDYRQSSQMWDVGNCIPGQSASFTAFGIGGQLVGFRGSCIIPDDVETQTNSLTVVMREKIEEAVKEFESVLTPGGVIKYLGTPHDVDSLYLKLLRLKDVHGKPVYDARIWPALFPSEDEIKAYGKWLAPYITAELRKQGPSIVGHSTMPFRFTDEDLEGRRAAMGNSEFRLQFMLDLSGSFMDKFPLRLKDLTVMDLDDRMGPDEVIWGSTNLQRDLPVMGHDGDFYYGPVPVERAVYEKYTEVIGYVDGSGRGADETSLSIVAELYGRLYWLHLWANTDGYGIETLTAIAKACVRFRVTTLYVESNYGDGMLVALLKPVLFKEWEKANKGARADDHGGTVIEEVKSGRVEKEKRILSVLEPITQQHRLVVSRAVIEWDHASLQKIEGEDSRHRYAWGYQYTHLTRERDCLGHDDRLESLSGACGIFAPRLGVDPLGMAVRAREDRYEDELERLLHETEEAVGRGGSKRPDGRPASTRPTNR
ncbi:phage terminase large subunit [Aminobacter sp. HY435]|uniref:phage terminase large subunit n=1 Tax=Aminobacter sp. HY435 TaxID=2970917 RepID=UPI0022B9B19D|nr:phage terminase large subunit [Aminobacter sp. HY435]